MAKNPVRFIHCGRSDGKLSVKNINNAPGSEQFKAKKNKDGATSLYRDVPPMDNKSVDWRKKLGLLVKEKLEATQSEQLGKPVKLDPNPNAIFMLFDFPENYRLYEHRTVHDPTSAERHPNDRRDCYLYGHPGGHKKRFRSPADFWPHLWWLLTDEQGNKENCSCKMCTTEDVIRAGEEMTAIQRRRFKDLKSDRQAAGGRPTAALSQAPGLLGGKTEQKMERAKPTSGPASPAQPGFIAAKQSTASPMARAGSISKVQQTATAPARSQVQRTAPQPPLTMQQKPPISTQRISAASPAVQKSGTAAQRPSPTAKLPLSPPRPALPEPRNMEQALDTEPGKFLFRVGELVWFQRSGTAYGLGVILKRVLQPGSDSFKYVVQPLSYPNHNHEGVTVPENFIKPWLAFSPPPMTHQMLNNFTKLPYEQISWSEVLNGRYGTGEAEVDASIFAARDLDRSYTPFEPLPKDAVSSNIPTGVVAYNGIFIGGEKIWRGDAVRLRSSNPQTAHLPEILVVTDILEQNRGPTLPPRPYLMGDRYVCQPQRVPPHAAAIAASSPPSTPGGTPVPRWMPPRNMALPSRVAEDLIFRNKLSIPKKSFYHTWTPLSPPAPAPAPGQRQGPSTTANESARTRLPLHEVRGRWYESQRMLPLIDANALPQQMEKGTVADVGPSLNGRGDATSAHTGEGKELGGTRMGSRIRTLGQSVTRGALFEGAMGAGGNVAGGVGGVGSERPPGSGGSAGIGAAATGPATELKADVPMRDVEGGEMDGTDHMEGVEGQAGARDEGLAQFVDMDDEPGFSQGYLEGLGAGEQFQD